MKIQLNRYIIKHVKNKKGFGLLSSMVYVVLAVILTISLYNSVSDIWSKFLMTKFQEEFLMQRDQFYTLLTQDLVEIEPNSLTVEQSNKDITKGKITFKTKTGDIEIVQGNKRLVYKRKTTGVLADGTVKENVTAVDFDMITSSSFNELDRVCLGESTPSDCYDINNALDVVLRFEKRIVRNPISHKSGRVIYHD